MAPPMPKDPHANDQIQVCKPDKQTAPEMLIILQGINPGELSILTV